jgi:hypothetical protein
VILEFLAIIMVTILTFIIIVIAIVVALVLTPLATGAAGHGPATQTGRGASSWRR